MKCENSTKIQKGKDSDESGELQEWKLPWKELKGIREWKRSTF